jgi:limonene-1,2-epoxide hydrolase
MRAFYAAWRAPKLEEIVSFFTEDAVYIDGPRGEHRGIGAITDEFKKQLNMGFGPIKVEYKRIVSDDRTVMAELLDTFEVAGHPITMEIACAFEVDEAGRIMRWREYYDLRSTTDQLRAIGISVPE